MSLTLMAMERLKSQYSTHFHELKQIINATYTYIFFFSKTNKDR